MYLFFVALLSIVCSLPKADMDTRYSYGVVQTTSYVFDTVLCMYSRVQYICENIPFSRPTHTLTYGNLYTSIHVKEQTRGIRGILANSSF